MNTYIPEGYKSLLGVYDTQKAIGSNVCLRISSPRS